MFDVNASLIRFWEKEFKQISPKKNAKGNRMFTAKDIETIKTIYHLVKERGFTLEGAKKKMKGNPDDLVKTNEAIERLQRIREYLVDLKDYI